MALCQPLRCYHSNDWWRKSQPEYIIGKQAWRFCTAVQKYPFLFSLLKIVFTNVYGNNCRWSVEVTLSVQPWLLDSSKPQRSYKGQLSSFQLSLSNLSSFLLEVLKSASRQSWRVKMRSTSCEYDEVEGQHEWSSLEKSLPHQPTSSLTESLSDAPLWRVMTVVRPQRNVKWRAAMTIRTLSESTPSKRILMAGRVVVLWDWPCTLSSPKKKVSSTILGRLHMKGAWLLSIRIII